MLQKIGFNNGVPIDEDYFVKNIAGKHNDDIAAVLFPDDIGRGLKFCEEKEEYFRKLVKKKVEPIKGLYKLTKWVEYHGLKRATVTNSPRENAELMISTLGLTDFFHLVIIGGECDHAKPAPDPYIKAIEVLNVSKEHTFICEVPPIIVQEIFTQVFSYINMQLLNSNGEYVKSGLSELEMWCYQVKDEYAGSVWDEFKHIRQAVRRLGSWLYIRSTGYHTISPTIYAL